MIANFIILVMILAICAAVFHANRDITPEECQRRALKRHHRERARERRRAQAYWKKRGHIIRPGRIA